MLCVCLLSCKQAENKPMDANVVDWDNVENGTL